jgi:hypothetical protein
LKLHAEQLAHAANGSADISRNRICRIVRADADIFYIGPIKKLAAWLQSFFIVSLNIFRPILGEIAAIAEPVDAPYFAAQVTIEVLECLH